MRLQALWLKRRRLDPILLAASFALLATMVSAGKIGFVLFAAAGLYLVAVRHRATRHLPPAYSTLLLAYLAWTVGLIAWRGELAEGGRALGYAGTQLAALFIPVGLCLVPRPLDAMVAGSRIALLMLLVAAPVQFALFGVERVDLGGNAAILAFLAGAVALVARIDMTRPPRWLPNGRWWTYVGLVPLFLTQTRAAWLIFPLVVLIDLVALARDAIGKRAILPIALALLGLGGATVLATPILLERTERALVELSRFQSEGLASGSVDARLAFWDASLEVLAAHPLTGVGAEHRMERVAAEAGQNAEVVLQYQHLHNVFLDEAVASGLIGLGLLVGIFVCALAVVWRQGGRRLATDATFFHLLVFSFGSFHGVFVNEWMIAMVFGFNAVVLTHLRRAELKRYGRGYGAAG